MKDFSKWIEACLTTYKGRTIGVVFGLLFGLLVLWLGFWRVIFVALCVVLGYWIGSFRDRKENFLSFLDKILPNGISNKIQ